MALFNVVTDNHQSIKVEVQCEDVSPVMEINNIGAAVSTI